MTIPTPAHGLLPWPAPEDLDATQRAFYDESVDKFDFPGRATPLTNEQGRFNGPYNAMLFATEIGRAYHAMGAALRFEGSLPRDVFEIIVLLVAHERDAAYEWYAHAPIARSVGVSADVVDAIRHGDDERVGSVIGLPLLRLVRATLAHATPAIEDVRSVEARYGRTGVIEGVATVGHFDAIGALMRTWRVPLPDGEGASNSAELPQ